MHDKVNHQTTSRKWDRHKKCEYYTLTLVQITQGWLLKKYLPKDVFVDF